MPKSWYWVSTIFRIIKSNKTARRSSFFIINFKYFGQAFQSIRCIILFVVGN